MGGDIVSEETRKDVITLSHVGMEFHLNKEKVDSLKEYFIKLVRHDIAYTVERCIDADYVYLCNLLLSKEDFE